jgi:hypothetical protein
VASDQAQVLVVTERWKRELQNGALVDARDEDGTWFDSVALNVQPDRCRLLVHYRCWENRWDKEIPFGDIAPYLTEAPNWRNFKVCVCATVCVAYPRAVCARLCARSSTKQHQSSLSPS